MVSSCTIHTLLVMQFFASLYFTEGVPPYKIKYHRKHPISRKPPGYRARPLRPHPYQHRPYYHHPKSFPDTKVAAQSWKPFYEENTIPQSAFEEDQALRKLTVYNRSKGPFPSKAPSKQPFENFVTPKGSGGYEVTTKKFEDTEPLPLSQQSADQDLAIALNDEDDDVGGGFGEGEGEDARGLYSAHPEHRNPLAYVDSYGRPLGGLRTPNIPKQLGKSSGRVRMQVFRGPTRVVGHGHKKKKWAQWGYYVVQPAVTTPHHSHPYAHSYPYPY